MWCRLHQMLLAKDTTRSHLCCTINVWKWKSHAGMLSLWLPYLTSGVWLNTCLRRDYNVHEHCSVAYYKIKQRTWISVDKKYFKTWEHAIFVKQSSRSKTCYPTVNTSYLQVFLVSYIKFSCFDHASNQHVFFWLRFLSQLQFSLPLSRMIRAITIT